MNPSDKLPDYLMRRKIAEARQSEAVAQALSDDSERGCPMCGSSVPCRFRSDCPMHHMRSASPDGEAEGEERHYLTPGEQRKFYAALRRTARLVGDETLARCFSTDGKCCNQTPCALDPDAEHKWSKESIRSLIREATEPLERRIEELGEQAAYQIDFLRKCLDAADRRIDALEKTSIPLADEPKDTIPASALKATRSTGKP